MHGEFPDHPPDAERPGTCPLDPPTAVHMDGKGCHRCAHNADPFKAEAALALTCRRQQRACLDRDADPLLLLENALLKDRLYGHARIDDVHSPRWVPLDPQLSDELEVPAKAIVEHKAWDRETLLP